VVVTIQPSAIPRGIGLYLKAWVASPGTQYGAYLSMEIDLVQATPSARVHKGITQVTRPQVTQAWGRVTR
jgi:hypothetical protein